VSVAFLPVHPQGAKIALGTVDYSSRYRKIAMLEFYM
jgi:hypothetical protein